ncbi:MAG: flagellin lysine-N-methylase [Coprococcus sp.]
MIYTYPDYYKKFSCIADKCPDTCCGKWQIVIDDDSLEKYEDYNGEYRDELRRKVNWKEGVFRHGRSGKCAFLRDDMLCDLYIHMGKERLCTTCRNIRDIRKNSRMCARFRYHFHVLRWHVY